jgi:hypothetical protein
MNLFLYKNLLGKPLHGYLRILESVRSTVKESL